eukprot:GSChrysophyteH1.ASY1.ANO1.1777.1 assembled CDS
MGHQCLTEVRRRRRRRKLRSSSESSALVHHFDFETIADKSSRGFRLRSADLHKDSLSHACHVHMLLKLASHPAVVNIAALPRKHILNGIAASILQSNTLPQNGVNNPETSWPYREAGLTGKDQVVIVGDTGLDIRHCMFKETNGGNILASTMESPSAPDLSKRKVVQYIHWAGENAYDEDGHGTHMAGSISGKDASESGGGLAGIAPEAKLAVVDLGVCAGESCQSQLVIPADSKDLFVPAKSASKIFSGSWGASVNMHDQTSASLDSYAYFDDHLALGVFAAGNEGAEGYYSIGSPALAKNVLTVGACESDFGWTNNIAYFSSVGPTYDGRIKPDIVSPGFAIQSSSVSEPGKEGCSYHYEQGTSSATAIIAGTAALVRQYFEDADFYQTIKNKDKFTPSGALLKAMLIHSGETMKKMKDSDTDHDVIGDGKRPDFVQGFGRVYLKNVLPLPNLDHPFTLDVYDNFVLKKNTEFSFFVTTPSGGAWKSQEDGNAYLKATLTWWDPPTTTWTERQVIHDLDLLVTEVSQVGTREFLNPSSGKPIWFGNGGDKPDHLNNVEQVMIKMNSAEGDGTIYRITVRANELLSSYGAKQKFALVVTAPKTSNGESSITAPSDEPEAVLTEELEAIRSICTDDQLEIRVAMTSNSGIGWPEQIKYALTSSSGTIHSNSLDPSQATSQLEQKEILCLSEGTYTVGLYEKGVPAGPAAQPTPSPTGTLTENAPTEQPTIQPTVSSDFGQAAIDINDCYIHIHGKFSQTKQAELNIVKGPDGILRCNHCNSTAIIDGISSYPMEVEMLGSIYGGLLSYGWHSDTSYSFANSDGDIIIENTLNQGIYARHKYCIPAGIYDFGFNSISTDDDFDESDIHKSGSWASSKGNFGVREYQMRLLSCDGKGIAVIQAYSENADGSMKSTDRPKKEIEATDSARYCSQSFADDDFIEEPSAPSSDLLLAVFYGIGIIIAAVIIRKAYQSFCGKEEVTVSPHEPSRQSAQLSAHGADHSNMDRNAQHQRHVRNEKYGGSAENGFGRVR